jgi:hypothetical protein
MAPPAEPPSDDVVEAFAKRVKGYSSQRSFERLMRDLAAHDDGGAELLQRLMQHRSGEVRGWAANVARRRFGQAAVHWLEDLARSRRVADQDEAMQQLEAIDREVLRPFIPQIRQMFRRSRSLHGPGGAAMWRLARLRDRDAAAIFRRHAERPNPAWYDHRMPLVLAAYLEDEGSLVRRLDQHDHEWMFWLAVATRLLDVPGAEDALRRCSNGAPDAECRKTCSEGLAGLLADRARPQPSWDIHTEE